MPDLERLADVLAGWGLHPFKVFVALVIPVLMVWLADRQLRVRAEAIEEEEARIRPSPEIRQR